MCVRVLSPLQLLDPASDLEDVAFTGKKIRLKMIMIVLVRVKT